MRPDPVAPRTVLLGMVAAWALAALGLAAAGMGRDLPEQSGAVAVGGVPSLPPAPVAPVLGPLAQYADISQRPLFASDRRFHPFSLKAESDKGPEDAPDFDLVLTSVLISPSARIAIVQKPDGSAAWRVREGAAPEGMPAWRLVSLEPRRAVFQGPDAQKEVRLRVFDGKAGQPVTAVVPPGASVVPSPNVDPPATMPGVTSSVPPSPPPPTDASAGDPAQIEAIRRRIEARREEMRRRAQNPTPPATVAPPAPPAPSS